MALWPKIFGGRKETTPRAEPRLLRPMASSAFTYNTIANPAQLEEALRYGTMSDSGEYVTPDAAMKVSAVYGCVRLICGTVANMPMTVMRRVDDQTRIEASDHPLWKVLKYSPNPWQKPAQFKRMMQAHVLLRGNAYALKVTTLKNQVQQLIPLNPDRMKVEQQDDLSILYTYTRKDGRQIVFTQDRIFHLYNLTFDGVNGVTPITYARDTIGSAIAMTGYGNALFKNGARVSGVLKHPGQIGPEALEALRGSMDEFAKGGSKEAKTLILEEGMEYERMAMTAEDAQWIAARSITNADIYRYFGVPPHMMGDTEKATSWGTGIEAQTQGYLTFTAEDHLTMWEEACTTDLLTERNTYVRAQRDSLVRADLEVRTKAMASRLQWGVTSPDEERALEDMNPRTDGRGGEYYDPPNTAGGQQQGTDNAQPGQNSGGGNA